ncbi:cation-translocating P-type ATPase [Guyparkeria sp. SCN-R1]|uniref:heavy metal translocating P-type ATPase n=1 Tax=Guyparkeria sp. SCN-R1 TaxID=2341113 RepID=UPI000F64919F|nr:cation-translocating P-type ATPase [Guyparkeria sp. SCN-R1]RRQ23955.1 cation-translocating P-type ATPase [Guyparkeria sp. SCN-R1]
MTARRDGASATEPSDGACRAGAPADASATPDDRLAGLDSLEGRGRALVTIEGLWCPSCAAATERVLRDSPGVLDAQVSFIGSAALLRWDPGRTSLATLAAAVRRLGYRLAPPDRHRTTAERLDGEIRALGVRLTLAAFFGVWTMLFSLLLYLGVAEQSGGSVGWWLALASVSFALPALALAGRPILLAGWRTLRTGVPGMDTLVSLGVLAALGLSAWQLSRGVEHVYADTAVMLVVLLTVGRLLEARALRRAAVTIDALHARLPEVAIRLHRDGSAETVAAESVAVGERIRVPAGERIPLDGILRRGEGRVDRAVLTGESRPAEVRAGDAVSAGCVNLERGLVVEVTARVGEREIDRIGERVIETVRARPGTQRLADRVARWLAPGAIGLATLTGMAGLLLGLPLEETLLRATSVLVVACPCAISIAVPIAYVTQAGRAADAGVLFRDAAALERLARIERVFLDKTGTLTAGHPAVAEVMVHQPLPSALPADRATLLGLAAAAEGDVEHVIARALRQAAGAPVMPLEARREDAGVSARHPRHGELLVGSASFLEAHGIPVHSPRAGDDMQVKLAIAGNHVATIVLDDPLRPAAAATVHALGELGIECGMLTGDRHDSALRVARAVGIPPERVTADCLPGDKARRLRAASGQAAFVGDGANDALALAVADVGIAVSNANSTAAMAAGVVLGGEGVDGVERAIRIARQGRRVMRQNLVFALGYNAGGLTLAAFGVIPPVMAAAAMAASSLTVILNAARHGGHPPQGSQATGLTNVAAGSG